MAEQLGIEWRDDDRIEIEGAQVVELLPARAQEMRGMRVRHLRRGRRIVKLLLAMPAGDPVIFDAGKFSQSRIRFRPKMFERPLEADVAVKFAIGWIAGITFSGAPDLPARIAIASERRRTGRREARSVDRAARPMIRQHQAMRINDEPTHVRFPEDVLNPGMISAFRQPESGGLRVKRRAIRFAADKNLRAHCFGRSLKQRQQTVRPRRGYDFDAAVLP